MAAITRELKYTGLPALPRCAGRAKQAAAKPAAPPYIPSARLVDVVNLALYLQKRPLLLKGEPGCGKTQLARAVAAELGLPFEFWPVKSTSRARDGLYTFDAVGRLQDAQLAARIPSLRRKVDNPSSYVKLGPLGRAFNNRQRTVVLIDEIDKADIDFPNDLLLELDEQYFIVEETGKRISARQPPIVFITSNDEKDLPDAFLRRCLFYFIEFPRPSQLVSIIDAHFPSSTPKVVFEAVKRFQHLRDQMAGKAGKKVSTSELLDWFKVLRRYPEDEALAMLNGELPFPEVLLKLWPVHESYLAAQRT